MVSLTPPTAKYFGPPVWCGWDAEWVTLPDGKGGYRNEVLGIVAVIECGGRRTRYLHVPKGPLRADRPTMAGFFQRAIRLAIREGTVPSMPDAITIFGHFIRGDLASFVDFWARRREFSGLGKTVVSGRAGHALDLAGEAEGGDPGERTEGEDEESVEGSWSRAQRVGMRASDGHRFRLRARFVDTIKLTPGGRGLAYVAEMNGMRKLDLHADLGIPAVKTRERPECAGIAIRLDSRPVRRAPPAALPRPREPGRRCYARATADHPRPAAARRVSRLPACPPALGMPASRGCGAEGGGAARRRHTRRGSADDNA